MGSSEMSESTKGDCKLSEKEGKIQRSLKSMVKQMQLSDNEIKYRMENFDNVDVVKKYLKHLKCTKCSSNFQQAIKRGDSVGIHPLLGVLMCDTCCDYYGDGDFSLDSEGEDKYCRWCGEGGTIFACSKCICGFCDVCIKKHFGDKGLEEVEQDDDWICYFCNPQPLWYLRSICSLAKEAAKNRRDDLKKSKEGTSKRKKRRKLDKEYDTSKSSSDSSSGSTKSSSTVKRKPKRRRCLRHVDKVDESSSSEDEKENRVNSKKGASRSKKQALERDGNTDSSESDEKNLKRKSKINSEESELENKKTLILQKLMSIWKLTKTITEVGFNSSRDKLRFLSKSKYSTLEHLKKEHDDLKSCMDVLVSSLNTASNSANSIKEDLTFETTKDETESFQSQEIKLKRFAEKFHEESDDKASVDSEGDSFRKEINEKEGRKKRAVRGTRKSMRETAKWKKRGTEEKNGGESSDSVSDREGKEKSSNEEEEKRNGNQESRDSGKESDPVKPLLKVKSFARMLDDNAYDRHKKAGTPNTIDLCEMDTDESEKESKKEESPKKSLEGKNKEQKVSVNGKVRKRAPLEEMEDEFEDIRENDLEKSAEGKNEKGSSERDKKKGERKKNERQRKHTSESESDKPKGKSKSKKKVKKVTSSDSTSDKEKEVKSKDEGKNNSASDNESGKQNIESERKEDASSDSENAKEDEEAKRKRKEHKESSDSETDIGKEKARNKQKEFSDSDAADESGMSSRKKCKDKAEKTEAMKAKKKKCATGGESNNESSGNEEMNFDGEGRQELESSSDNRKETHKSDDNVRKSKEATDGDKEGGNESEKLPAGDENGDGDDAKNKEFDVTTDEDDTEKEKKKKGNTEEKNKGEASNSDVENAKKEKSNTESHEVKELSGSEGEGKKKSASSDEKNDSSDSDSEKSSPERKSKRKSKNQKNQVKASFEKFKRKRERFLKSSKENSQTENEEEKVSVTKALESSEDETEKNETKKKVGRPKKKRILASSDEENDGEKAKETSSSEESEKKSQEESELEVKPSSSNTTSDEEVTTKKRKRIRKRQKGSSDSSEEENHKKKKRDGSSSDSSEDDKSKKKKKGRKNIKKILKKESLQVETKEAVKKEEERKKRLKERQKHFDELFPQEEGEVPKRLVLDFNPETKEPVVTVHKKLVKKLKPHQVRGVKFMWDSCFESVQKLEEESGSGCILAHCMGLGKTLQVITLVHTVMTHDLGVNTVLIVCPLSTVSNWIREFEMWLANIHTDPITLYDLVKYKKREERLFHLKDWHENGGVLVLSYDLFRNLTKTTGKKEKKKKPKFQQIFETTLLDPGPDLVVCDEGHLLKNEDTALSRCMSRVKTSRRIVLTGTPLQNNLIEYHCMVQFVKPNILGTKKEFCNRFVNPINNGQFEDSTELDVKIMKRRSHVLHSMLDGCIQRFDYSVLTPFLPEKHEYVLSIALTETQAKVYMHFINNLSAKSSGSSRVASLFNDYHSLQRIWTHPRAMLMQSEKETLKEEMERDSEGSLRDFVVPTSEESERSGSSDSSDDSIEEVPVRKRVLRSNANDPEVQKAIEEEEKQLNKHWWDEFYDEKAYDDIRESNKLIILFSLLKHCAQRKDKILVFSQSLYSLDLIEYFLARIDENSKKNDETLCGHRDNWILGSDYFRLDGSTSSDTRALWCKHFNKESNTRARLFLISTRAGGLGINLYGANRVIIFDASWNPSHDLQSIFRVYRFGQKKACYIYRFLSEATMEEKIYERQVTKLSLAHRVVDEHQIERHYTMGNLQELYAFQPTPKEERKVPKLPKDPVFADILTEHKDIVVGYHEHDSLLENKQEEELSEEERKAAWKEYEEEKTQKTFNFNPAMLQQGQFVQGQLVQGQFAQGQFLQGQFVQGGGVMQQVVLPNLSVNSGQNYINPMFIQSNVPLETLQRGLRVGVTPLQNESLNAYVARIYNKEAWLQARQAKEE